MQEPSVVDTQMRYLHVLYYLKPVVYLINEYELSSHWLSGLGKHCEPSNSICWCMVDIEVVEPPFYVCGKNWTGISA